jgi:hypothetical protein
MTAFRRRTYWLGVPLWVGKSQLFRALDYENQTTGLPNRTRLIAAIVLACPFGPAIQIPNDSVFGELFGGLVLGRFASIGF